MSQEPSPTAYDDSFRTMVQDCSGLIIPVVNVAFDEHYTGKEKIIFSPNEHFLPQDDGSETKRITDTSFVIVGLDGARKRYHMECQALPDSRILIRLFEYDAQIALDDGEVEGEVLTVTFPHTAVLSLRHTSKTTDTMRVRMVTPGGEVEYTVPIVKVQQYSLADIFDKKLLFFIPFYIFSHEKDFSECESDESKLNELKDEYRLILVRMEELQKAGELDEFTKVCICNAAAHVIKKIAEKYQRVQEGVGQIMFGKVLQYEAKKVRNEGINIGRNEGISIGRNEGISIGRNEGISIGRDEERKLATAETEERAKDMLRDRMEVSLVEKYTRLPLPRIQELARGLGML